jgi:Domain of unknown function (DUF4145)
MTGPSGTVVTIHGDLEPEFKSLGFLDFTEVKSKPAPDHLPPAIQSAFQEGTKCLATNCANAACAMFRLCLDLATKDMLPAEGAEQGPTNHQRRNLSARLEWLFEQGRLLPDLKELSQAVRDNGNDGAHDGNLTMHDAEDMYDFAFALFNRLYAEPQRLALANERRAARRQPAQ